MLMDRIDTCTQKINDILSKKGEEGKTLLEELGTVKEEDLIKKADYINRFFQLLTAKEQGGWHKDIYNDFFQEIFGLELKYPVPGDKSFPEQGVRAFPNNDLGAYLQYLERELRVSEDEMSEMRKKLPYFKQQADDSAIEKIKSFGGRDLGLRILYIIQPTIIDKKGELWQEGIVIYYAGSSNS